MSRPGGVGGRRAADLGARRASGRRARRGAAIAILAAIAAAGATAEAGLSLASWSFGGTEVPAERGLYARVGLVTGLAERLELEAFAILEATPRLLGTSFLGAELALPLFGGRSDTYFNSFLGLGWAARLGEGGAIEPGFVSLRLAPLAIGNPSYGRRDRIFSLGLLWAPADGTFSFAWSYLAMDFFPGPRAGAGARGGSRKDGR